MSWETLKPREGSVAAALAKRSAGKVGAQKQSAVSEIDALRDKLGGFESRLATCHGHLASLQDQAALLPQMHAALREIVDAHRGPSA